MDGSQLNDLSIGLKNLETKFATFCDEVPKKHEYRSTELNELFAALGKAQAEMTVAGLTNDNPFFKSKYADLATIVKATRPALTKHNLCVLQQVLPNEKGQSVLHTMLAHSSGQWISSQMPITPLKNDVQSFGSYITYLRRYSYAALVGVITADEDDDAERAMGRGVVVKVVKDDNEKITPAQLRQLNDELYGYPHIEQEIMEKMKLKNLADFPKSKLAASIEKIKVLKTANSKE